LRELTNEKIKREKGINAKIAKKSEPFQTVYCATVFDKANLNADDTKGDKCTNFVASSEYCCCVHAMNVSIAENNSIRSREPVQRKIYRHKKKLKFKKNNFLSFIFIFFIDKNLKYTY
jgi:hypothetical protein